MVKGNKHMKTIIHILYPAVKTVTRTLAGFAALTLICVTGFRQPAEGAGGGGGNTGGGTIYYVHTGIKTTWMMNSDGSNQTQLGFGTYGPVSTVMFNGHRWFLDTREIGPREYYPDGGYRIEVFALRDDYDFNLNNNSATRVKLTDDITFQTCQDGLFSLHWVPGGQKISIKARRWSGGFVVEGGIYTASLQFGADGNIIGLAAQPAAPAIPFPLDGNLWPNVRTHCWDPTGSKVAYDNSAALWVADLLGSPHQRIAGYALNPQWSPDGNKIAFANSILSIMTINPNGSGLREIIRRTSSWTFDRPFWSVSGSHIVCYGIAGTGPYNLDVFRVASNGNSLTNLTNTPSTAEYPMGWR
jgi:hypothetical protein